MDGPRDYHTKGIKPDRQISYGINLYVESKKKNDTNVLSCLNHFFYHLQLNLILISITDS